MPHKQLPFVVLAAWVILLRLTFYSLARLLARSFSPPPSSPSPCPSVHCGAPLPCVVTAVSGWCLAALGGSQLCAWSPGAVQSVSGCLSLSLVGWGSTGAWMPRYHLAPATPDLAAVGRSTHRHTHTHKLPSCLADFAQRPSRFRISSRICRRSPITPSICLRVHWFLQRNPSSFTQRGFYISADGRSGSTLLSHFFFVIFFLCTCCDRVFLCLPGTNVHEAKRILTESGLPITAAENLDDAAKKAVAAIKK